MKPFPILVALSLLAGCQTVTRTRVAEGWVRSVEYRGAPENALLTQRVIRTGNEYYPKIAAILGEPEDSLTPFDIIFVKSLALKSGRSGHLGNPIGGVPVAWRPRVVYLDGAWLDKNPAYIDAVLIHEMTHLVQRYGWRHAPAHWVEGIADYVPAKLGFAQGRFSDAGASHYSSGYGSAALFLLDLEKKYGAEVIRALHRSLRERDDTGAIFLSTTGRSLEELWADYRRTSAHRVSAEVVDQLYRELELDGTESHRVKASRLERYIDRHYDRAKAAEVRLEIGYRDGKPPPDVLVRYATFRTRRSLEAQLAQSLQDHIQERIRNNTLPWMNEREIREAAKLGRMPWADQRGPGSQLDFEGYADPPSDFARKFPVTLVFTGTNSGQALFYHYEFALASPRAKWRLKRAWIAEPDGRVVEERVFSR